MQQFKPATFSQLWFLLLAMLCSASMYRYWSCLPRNSGTMHGSISVTRARPLTDLFQPWYASREFFLHHRDPYSTEVTHEIQTAFYGNDAVFRGMEGPAEQRFSLAYRFAYPLYMVFFLAPTIGMQFRTAQAVLWWVLAAATTLAVPFWLRMARIRMSLIGTAALCALVVTSLPAMQGLYLRQLGLLVAAFIAAAAACAVAGRLFQAGVILALATIKPQLLLLPMAWLALWVSADWQRRRPLAVGFAAMLASLLLASELLLPAWPMSFLVALQDYAKYTGAASLTGMLLPTDLRWPLVALGLCVTAAFCWRSRSSPADSDSFALAFALALNLSVLIVPTVVASYNQILLVPAALIVAARWRELQLGTSLVRVASLVLTGIAVLQWLLAFVLSLVSMVPPGRVLATSLIPGLTGLALPFATFALLIMLRWTSGAVQRSPDPRGWRTLL